MASDLNNRDLNFNKSIVREIGNRHQFCMCFLLISLAIKCVYAWLKARNRGSDSDLRLHAFFVKQQTRNAENVKSRSYMRNAVTQNTLDAGFFKCSFRRARTTLHFNPK